MGGGAREHGRRVLRSAHDLGRAGGGDKRVRGAAHGALASGRGLVGAREADHPDE